MNLLIEVMDAEKLKVFATIQHVCEVGMKSGKINAARQWLADQKLSYELTGAVFNSGQISQHKTKEYLENIRTANFITPSTAPQNMNRPRAYTVFAKYSVMFPLKNKEDQVVNYYAVRIKSNDSHWLNDEGIYPGYPQANTKTLFIVPTVLDAATILETRALQNREAVIALRDGVILPEHLNVIHELEHLKEIIVIDK